MFFFIINCVILNNKSVQIFSNKKGQQLSDKRVLNAKKFYKVEKCTKIDKNDSTKEY